MQFTDAKRQQLSFAVILKLLTVIIIGMNVLIKFHTHTHTCTFNNNKNYLSRPSAGWLPSPKAWASSIYEAKGQAVGCVFRPDQVRRRTRRVASTDRFRGLAAARSGADGNVIPSSVGLHPRVGKGGGLRIRGIGRSRSRERCATHG